MRESVLDFFYPGNIPTVVSVWTIIGGLLGTLIAYLLDPEKLRNYIATIALIATLFAFGINKFYTNMYGPVEMMLPTELAGSFFSPLMSAVAVYVMYHAVSESRRFANWNATN